MWTAIGAIFGLLSTIGGIWLFYAKLKRTPTVAERIDALDEEYTDTIENIHRLRSNGRLADADAMLRRLNNRAIGTTGVFYNTFGTKLYDNTVRERVGNPPVEGNQDPNGGSKTA